MYGKDYDYANNRLAGTVIRLGDEPVFVHRIGRDGVAHICKLIDTQEDLFVKFEELNCVPVSLGMCNFEKTVSYLSRIPLRHDWRQGLRRENFVSDNIPNGAIPPEELAKVIKGDYPTFAECLELIKSKAVKAVAWSRVWALNDDMTVRYKHGVVGEYRGGDITLHHEKQYLYECLREAV